METGLGGKAALVTGGGSGIGRAIALALAREGANVVIASRNPDPKTVDQITACGVHSVALSADVSKEDQVISMVERTIQFLGGLDLYVNNAAVHWDEPVTRITSEAWCRTMDTNLSACAWACREVSRHFISQGRGSILIVGSTCTVAPLHREAAYRSSKAGLKAYMEVLAVELAPFRIRVNMLTPGYFHTSLSAHLGAKGEAMVLDTIPLGRAGEPEPDIGPAALFLLSDVLSPYTTGAELVVDGGYSLRPPPYYTKAEISQMNL